MTGHRICHFADGRPSWPRGLGLRVRRRIDLSGGMSRDSQGGFQEVDGFQEVGLQARFIVPRTMQSQEIREHLGKSAVHKSSAYQFASMTFIASAQQGESIVE